MSSCSLDYIQQSVLLYDYFSEGRGHAYLITPYSKIDSGLGEMLLG